MAETENEVHMADAAFAFRAVIAIDQKVWNVSRVGGQEEFPGVQ